MIGVGGKSALLFRDREQSAIGGRLENQMFFRNDIEGKERYGTVIAALGLDPKKVTPEFLKSLEKEFGCPFERGKSLIWVQETEERAEQIFDTLAKKYFPFRGTSRKLKV